MKTHIKYPDLHFLQFAKSATLIIFILLWITPVKAQLGGGGLDENKPYDLSDFKPLTAEKFIETDFPFIKRAYDKFPDILVKGYEIEIIPNKRPGFRPSVKTNQLYAQLLESAVLEWAILNNYTVYRDSGYRIEQKLGDGTEISININPSFWGPKYNKTIEKDFDETHRYHLYTNATSDYSLINKRYSTIHGLKSYESEVLTIADKKLIDEYLKKVSELRQAGKLDKETGIETLKNFSNHYEGGIEIITSKYGEVAGDLIKNQKDKKGIKANLMPLKSMINSMLTFCDHKISKARSLFMDKLNSK